MPRSNTRVDGNAWCKLRKVKRFAELRLFCFAYAGGSARSFRDWSERFPDEVEVVPVELPGRGVRIGDPAVSSLPTLIDDALPALKDLLLEKPFAFFGHSMGGLVAFELARRLRKEHQVEPELLVVSASKAPNLVGCRKPIHALPKTELIEELRKLNGTPEELLKNDDLMDLLLPAIRADFSILETYEHVEEVPLACPILALYGQHDGRVPFADMADWNVQTSGRIRFQQIAGGHFFVNSGEASVIDAVKQTLPIPQAYAAF